MSQVIAATYTFCNEPFFEYTLANISPLVDSMIVLETYIGPNRNLVRTDRIEQIINQSPYKNKIIYENLGKVPDKEFISDYVLYLMRSIADEGDWLVFMGSDEAWYSEAITLLREVNENILEIMFPFWDFIGDFNHILIYDPPREAFHNFEVFYDIFDNWMVNGVYHERAYRWFKGYHYGNNHTAVKDSKDRYIYNHSFYKDKRIYIPHNSKKLRWTHYGNLGTQKFQSAKKKYYEDQKSEFTDKDFIYRYISTGNDSNLPLFFRIEEINIEHPYPFNDHPWRNLSREEIFNAE